MKDMDLVGFTKADIDNVLNRMAEKDIDKLAFGAVELDKNGTVRHASAGVTSRSDLEDWLAER